MYAGNDYPEPITREDQLLNITDYGHEIYSETNMDMEEPSFTEMAEDTFTTAMDTLTDMFNMDMPEDMSEEVATEVLDAMVEMDLPMDMPMDMPETTSDMDTEMDTSVDMEMEITEDI